MKRLITLVSAMVLGFTGYSQIYIDEDFSTFTQPVNPPLLSGWKNVDSIPNRMSDSIWRFDNLGARTPSSPIVAPFASIDGDAHGSSWLDDAYLTSTDFDASAATVVLLEFDHVFRSVGTGGAEVQIFDGAVWNVDTIFTQNTDPTGADVSKHEVIDISQYAAGVSNAQVRFRYLDPGWGWYWIVDNVLITQPLPDDVAVISVDSLPETACALDTNEKITASLVNVGSTVISNIPVSYTINGGIPILETVTATILPGDTLQYTFTTRANLAAAGSYNINVLAALRADANPVNDTAFFTVNLIPAITGYPYTQGFESGNGGWVTGGNNGTWAIGTPAGAIINSAANGVNAYVTNLTGTYNANDASFVISPCFDFTSLNSPQFKMNIWYESESSWDGSVLEMTLDDGLTWTQVGAFGNPNNWYNDNTINGLVNAGLSGDGWCISGGASSGGWVLAEHDLAAAANQPSVRLRIWHGSDGSVQLEGFGFDDIVIQEAPAFDVGVVALESPGNSCGFGTNDSVVISVANFGSAAVSNIPVEFELVGLAIVSDTVRSTINPGDTVLFTFTTGTVNLSVPGMYNFNIYSSLAGDGNILNDSATAVVENSLKTAPFSENFDSFALGTALLNGWTSTTSNTGGFGSYLWQINSGQTGSFATGPNADNTTGSGNYIYTEASNGAAGDITTLTSPCIDVSALTGATLEFYYHMFGTEINTLYIEVGNNNGFTIIDSIVGAQQTAVLDPFNLRSINITSYLGAGNINVRFSSVSLGCCGGDISIDDFRVFEPSANDISLIDITSPLSNCGLSTADSVKVLLVNVGTAAVNTIPVVYETGGLIITDTSFVSLNPGDTTEFTFSTTVNFSVPGLYDITAYSDLSADGDRSRDTSTTQVENSLKVAPYIEDFDLMNAGNVLSNGWSNSSTGTYDWRINSGQTGSANTGPSADNTTGNGNYIYTEASNGAAGQIATLESPCIDASSLNSATLEFYYHMFGTEINTLYIEVGNNNGYVLVDSIVGAQQTGTPDPFTKRTINITNLLGSGNLSVRFSSVSLGCCGGDISIDDFRIFEPSSFDVSVLNIISPISGAYTTGQSDSVRITIANVGSDTATNFTVNYVLNNGAVQTETIAQMLPSQSTTYTFNSTVTLPAPGMVSTLDVYVDFSLDPISSNDSILGYVFDNDIKGVPYTQDFETFGTLTNGINFDGWTNNSGGTAPDWSTGGTTGSTGTGPAADHTTGSGTFMYLETSGGVAFDDDTLISPVFQVAVGTNPLNLKYWYHMHGISMDTMRVFMRMNGSLIALDTIRGEQQIVQTDPWLQKVIALPGSVNGNTFEILFVGTRGSSYTGDMAIDDIEIDLATGINSVSSELNGISIAPNPSKGLFTLRIKTQENDNFEVVVRDAQGRLVYNNNVTVNGTYKTDLDFTSFAKGVYYMHIQTEEGSSVEKLIIQ